MASIKVQGISVKYSQQESGLSLKKALINVVKGSGQREISQEKGVIKNLSFDLFDGDRLILIGGNGVGKTTLLKTLSGIYEPYLGSISINGSKSSLIEIGAGLDFNLNGKKNVELHYLMRALDKSKIDRQAYVKAVRDFSGLGKSFYRPVNSYSSGMFVRLAFAMVTEISPEILLLDEWLSAGDTFFMEKASLRMEQLANTAKILILATHSEELALRWGNKALVLGKRKHRIFDDVDEGLQFYKQQKW